MNQLHLSFDAQEAVKPRARYIYGQYPAAPCFPEPIAHCYACAKLNLVGGSWKWQPRYGWVCTQKLAGAHE